MNPQDEKQDTVQTSAFNPFPEPQTIPSGWDMSELFSMPQPAPVEKLDDVAEEAAK